MTPAVVSMGGGGGGGGGDERWREGRGSLVPRLQACMGTRLGEGGRSVQEWKSQGEEPPPSQVNLSRGGSDVASNTCPHGSTSLLFSLERSTRYVLHISCMCLILDV